MRVKVLLLIGFLAGYVLGARAGRQRYDQITDLAGRVWGSPQVREARANAASGVAEAVPHLRHAVADAGAKATQVVRDKVSSDD